MSLSELLSALKAAGVAHFQWTFEDDPISIDFVAPVATEIAHPKLDLSGAEDDACRCGHANYQHVNGLCTVGCDVTACAGPETGATK